MMTPEERWRKIDNSIEALLAVQSQHDARIAALNKQTDKNAAAIRDLIIVSRSLVDAQQAREKEFKQFQANIDSLIQMMKDFLKGFHKPNGNQ